MTGLFESFLPLLAQAPKVAPAAGAGGENNLIQYAPFILVFVLLYFMMIRPQQQQEKRRRAMIDALKKNDRVLTSAGIFGTVVSVDAQDDSVVLRVDDGVKMTFSKASIARVVESSKDKPKEATATS